MVRYFFQIQNKFCNFFAIFIPITFAYLYTCYFSEHKYDFKNVFIYGSLYYFRSYLNSLQKFSFYFLKCSFPGFFLWFQIQKIGWKFFLFNTLKILILFDHRIYFPHLEKLWGLLYMIFHVTNNFFYLIKRVVSEEQSQDICFVNRRFQSIWNKIAESTFNEDSPMIFLKSKSRFWDS